MVILHSCPFFQNIIDNDEELNEDIENYIEAQCIYKIPKSSIKHVWMTDGDDFKFEDILNKIDSEVYKKNIDYHFKLMLLFFKIITLIKKFIPHSYLLIIVVSSSHVTFSNFGQLVKSLIGRCTLYNTSSCKFK